MRALNCVVFQPLCFSLYDLLLSDIGTPIGKNASRKLRNDRFDQGAKCQIYSNEK